MSILSRINRIVKANVQWLLDKVEDPEQELENRIREIQDAITEGRACAATYGATFKRMQAERDGLVEKQRQLQARAETALAGGDDELARASLRDKIVLEERIAGLAPGIDRGRKTYDELRENLARLQDQLKETKLKLAELRARKRSADAHIAFDRKLASADAGTAETELERMEDDVLQAEAEADVREEMRSGQLSDRELEQRSRDLQVDAELEALRSKLGNS